jgi:hypothetical protein
MSHSRMRIGLLGLVVVLSGCKSQEDKNREEYEAKFPAVKPHVDALRKVADAPITSPACSSPPQGPVLVVTIEQLKDALAGKRGGPTKKLEPVNKHPCSLFDVQRDISSLSQPLDTKKDFGSNYRAAIADTAECFDGIHAIVVQKRSAYVAPKADGAGTFQPGLLEGDLMVYTKTGEPTCVHHIKVVSKGTEQVNEKSANLSLESNLGFAYDQEVLAYLGMTQP